MSNTTGWWRDANGAMLPYNELNNEWGLDNKYLHGEQVYSRADSWGFLYVIDSQGDIFTLAKMPPGKNLVEECDMECSGPIEFVSAVAYKMAAENGGWAETKEVEDCTKLTNIERHVLEAFASRKTWARSNVACALNISTETVALHMQHIKKKLGVHKMESAILVARRNRLIR